MAHSILLVVDKPDVRNHNIERKWGDFVRELSDLTTNTNIGIQMLGENVLLIALDKTLNILSDILSLVGDLPYKYSILDEEIEWHQVLKT